MGEGRPEPIHLTPQEIVGGKLKISFAGAVIETNSTNLVRDTIAFLKTSGVDHEAQVIIYGVSNNPAFNGALKHYGA
jgi:hypothetical protein